MNYRERSTQRKIKNRFINIIDLFKFKSLNLTLPKKIILVWAILNIISLFLPWVVDTKKNIPWNSFNSISWNIWYLLFIIIFIALFIIFSTNYKEKLKLYSNISFKNHFIIINTWIFILSFSIISLSFINWLQTYFESITYGQWTILSMTSWIVILIWGLLLRKEYKKENSEIIFDKINSQNEVIPNKNNMKLPF